MTEQRRVALALPPDTPVYCPDASSDPVCFENDLQIIVSTLRAASRTLIAPEFEHVRARHNLSVVRAERSIQRTLGWLLLTRLASPGELFCEHWWMLPKRIPLEYPSPRKAQRVPEGVFWLDLPRRPWFGPRVQLVLDAETLAWILRATSAAIWRDHSVAEADGPVPLGLIRTAGVVENDLCRVGPWLDRQLGDLLP